MDSISQFCAAHSLDASGDYSNIVIPLSATTECHDLVSRVLCDAIGDSPKQNVLAIAYGNIVGRIHEHAEAMLVCIATNAYASAEVLARTVLESSVNLSFKVKHDLEAPLIAYFKRWLSSHRQTLTDWKKHETQLGDPDGTKRIVEARLEWLANLETFLDSLIKELSLDNGASPHLWPRKIFKRFEDVGQQSTYYTSYHRLSSASHALAEDTLLYLQAFTRSDAKALQELGVVAISYSVMMSYIATISVTQAFESLAQFYQPNLERNCFHMHRTQLENEISSIAAAAGCIK
ncbi:DUF5677 domain-containing protein [Thiocystis violacea]|uniref:DUF5677 domain-containing protein n=1 Tax=Thiocystis violacea TaxID=13725 RepID=UPI001905A6D1|nr:DUF5677 domain-containing protein [Thiocystis violacea]MBK1719316.1 hypothetical protein [Thiocystis violacea]